MTPCRYCYPFGKPGYLPVIVERSAAERALPAHLRPPAQVIWTPCSHCIGAVASCCEDAGAEGQDNR